MALAEPIKKLTEAEYLEIERAAETKSEFFDGEMFGMSGGSPRHSQIAMNLSRELGNYLRGHPCTPYNSDLRVKVDATGLFTYPDLSIVCGPLDLAEGTKDTVINPAVIVEVLSPSTEGYDRGKKFENYRLISSLKEYLLVSQDSPHIEQFIRSSPGEWTLREASGFESSLSLPALDISISLGEVYLDVDFTAAS